MKTRASVPFYRQGGFSLLEALIAVLIFSIGLLGLAGLQIIAMKANQNAMLRSIASEAAYELLDLYRAQAKTAKASGTIVGVDKLNTHISGNLPSGVGSCTLSGSTVSTMTASCTVRWSQASVNGSGVWQTTDGNAESVTVVGAL